MGITVISSTSLSNPGKSAGPQQATDGGGNGFAALLSQQFAGPQALEVPLQLPGLKVSLENETDAKDPSEEDGSLGAQDPASDLLAAGLLPAFMTSAAAIQRVPDPALPARLDHQAGEEQITGILGQLKRDRGSEENVDPRGIAAADESPTSFTGKLLQTDTANLAVVAQQDSGTPQNFAAALAAHTNMGQQVQHSQEKTVASQQISIPLQDSRWSQDFSDKVVWLAKNDQQVAQISINPPQLGPMHITLNLNGDQATALFVSAHAEVRQAIEDAMPHLREMLAGSGINLGQANVGTQLPQQQNNGTPSQFSASSRSPEDTAILRADNELGTAAPLTSLRSGRGMVDLFA